MAHSCPSCDDLCYCDLEDAFSGAPADCAHLCDESDFDDDDDCIHVSYSEQAGGFLICDECGTDVTFYVETESECTGVCLYCGRVCSGGCAPMMG